MASPLHVFRKYQKQMMTALLLVAMFTFVVGTPLAVFLSSGGQAQGTDKVAVSWKGGKLYESNLYSLRSNHHMLINFLEGLTKKARESNGSPKATPIARAGEEEIVLRLIKAHKAEQMGLVVTEDAMLTYLELLSAGAVQPQQMNSILNDTTGGRLNERAMLMQLRTELLAQKLDALALGDWTEEATRVEFMQQQPFAVPPAMAWDYFGRMHRRVRAEMVPLKAEDFLAKVKDQPTESQIKESYEKFKDKYPNPFSPDPGYKKYNRVAFQYVKHDANKILAEEKAKVTEEQIADHYEKNKATYVELDLPEPPLEKPVDKKPEDKKPDDKQPEKDPSEKPEDKKPEDAKPEDKKPDETKPEEKKPEEKKTDESKPDDAKPEEKKPEEKPECADDEPAATEAKQDDPAKADPKDEPKKEGDEPAKTEPADPKDVPAKPKSEEKTEQPKDETEKPKTVPAKPKKKEIKYKPLNDKLKEDIRGQIAAPLAQARRLKAEKEVQDVVQEYGREFRRWQDLKKHDPKIREPQPEPFDLKELARSHGMGFGEIAEPVDVLTMLNDSKKEQPKYEISRGRLQAGNQGTDFVSYAFEPGAPLYTTHAGRLFGKGTDFSEVHFVFWRTKEEEARVPDLKEARPDVVEALQKQAAFALARQAAHDLAAEVKKSGKSIKETLPADEAGRAFETDTFSWLSRNTPMGGQGQYAISRIRKAGVSGLDDDNSSIDTAGEDFMAAVFALKTGETGVAENHPQTEAYVVRIIDEPISEELLLQMFLASTNKVEVYRLALRDRGRQFGDWQTELEKEMAIKWQRDPVVSDRM